MRKLAALILLLLAAACSDGIRVDPSTATIAVGQTVTLEARRIPSSYQGIPWPPNRIEFGGEGAAVSAAGVMEARDDFAGIVVQGVEPGIASIVSRHYDAHTPGLITITVATVTVYACPVGLALAPQFATIEGRLNERVVLHVESSFPGGTYQWYAGARGETSHPIPFTNAPYYADFVPLANGSYPFWVRQTSECNTAEAAFVVNVGNPQRRRAAGH
ncbi:MAG TPA: hypothetical protein VF713_07400 [Thermoanaerobaculia bacterium]